LEYSPASHFRLGIVRKRIESFAVSLARLKILDPTPIQIQSTRPLSFLHLDPGYPAHHIVIYPLHLSSTIPSTPSPPTIYQPRFRAFEPSFFPRSLENHRYHIITFPFNSFHLFLAPSLFPRTSPSNPTISIRSKSAPCTSLGNGSEARS